MSNLEQQITLTKHLLTMLEEEMVRINAPRSYTTRLSDAIIGLNWLEKNKGKHGHR
jgi:hypothetical protein